MKLFKKRSNGEESYWKSFTDIMAGLLLIILLVLMLLLLLLTQMNKNNNLYDYQYNNKSTYDEVKHNNNASNKYFDEMYKRQYYGQGGGGTGGGYPVSYPTSGKDTDYGHDKAAVFVTVVDEETGKTIKKEGITFELFRGENNTSNLQTLHTYYPEKVAYKRFQTTSAGTFFLPEKIPFSWYTLHNVVAPKGYSFADDKSFEVRKSYDWNEPYKVTIKMSPSKGVIHIKSIDADTKKTVAKGTYEVYADEDVKTLDGTIRYKAGEKADEFTCDVNGKGASKKLYFGKYSVVQKNAPKYYAVNKTPLTVELNYTTQKEKVYSVESQKTRIMVTLLDEQTNEPVSPAEYTVTNKTSVKTNSSGNVVVTDLDKKTKYTLTLKSVPKPYRIKDKELSFEVDENGLINGEAVSKNKHTVYIIRLVASAKDMLFGNELSGGTIRLLDSNGAIVEEWSATGNEEEFQDLKPGSYTIEVDKNASSHQSINLKDQGGKQMLSTTVWTLWDTIAVAAGVLVFGLLVALVVSLIRSRRRKKDNEKE